MWRFLLLLLLLTTPWALSYRHAPRVSSLKCKPAQMVSDLLKDFNAKLLMENAERLGAAEHNIFYGNGREVKVLTPISLDIVNQKRLSDGSLFATSLLIRDGVISVKQVIPPDLCDKLSFYINESKEKNEKLVNDGKIVYDEYFGAVNNRRNRADMFLPMGESCVKTGITTAIQSMKNFLSELPGMSEKGILHELSSLIADQNAPAQCTHCDTPWLEKIEPLYTFFIALQDVEDDMGHTTFLPKTHVNSAHKIFNGTPKSKENLLKVTPAARSSLKKGDVVIFDSRILHCGGANKSSKRRILFYFTLTTNKTTKEADPWNPSRYILLF